MNLQTVKPRARLVRCRLNADGEKIFGDIVQSVPVWRVRFPNEVCFASVDLDAALNAAYRHQLHAIVSPSYR